jgi:hypothetical protein
MGDAGCLINTGGSEGCDGCAERRGGQQASRGCGGTGLYKVSSGIHLLPLLILFAILFALWVGSAGKSCILEDNNSKYRQNADLRDIKTRYKKSQSAVGYVLRFEGLTETALLFASPVSRSLSAVPH